ncbi:MAG: hypothetical protein KatS3mg108_1830 [Isosphaeraceae bacterium]|nr:MAG: hypothetical protein KatS3mg108_1830 [Isosphaeraceae bacterium]
MRIPSRAERAMMDRRDFLGAIAVGLTAGPTAHANRSAMTRPYDGRNVILIRFGGGVRRQETIDADASYAPFLKNVLAPQGVLFPQMQITDAPGIVTSHGEGTLNILTGKYDVYRDIDGRLLGARFEAKVPTLFEALRKAYDVPTSQALIINGEDRIDEEFYSFSNHHLFGVDYRSSVLSLYRFKLHLLRRDLEQGRYSGRQEPEKRQELRRLEQLDRRARDVAFRSPEIDHFWDQWAAYYGRSGLVNPRGDRLLCELALRALRTLRPRLMLINFNDPDYVHWGNPSHYTRGVTIIDESLQRIHQAVEADDFYRGRTVFVVVPDCGRDNNPLVAVPYQHHFNSAHARRIFAVLWGPGIDRGRIVDRPVEQCQIAATVSALMGFEMPYAEGQPLAEAFA